MQNEGGADYVFDAPIDLAANLCGFNPNTFDREIEVTRLKVVRKDLMKLVDQRLSTAADRPPVPGGARKCGLLARLLGLG